MRSIRLSTLAAILGCCMACNASLADPAPSPQAIVVGGHAEITIPPTHGRFTVAVTTTGATAAAAGADNARLSKAVSEALAAVGMTREELLGTRLNINARWDYDERGRRKGRTTYEATNTLRIESARLEQLGVMVDAALGGGATSVSDVEFSSRNVKTARRQALAQAVEDARAEAETIARAAGGSLGELLYISSERGDASPVELMERPLMAARMGAPPPPPTSVAPSDIVVSAQVNARWAYLPARR